MTHAVLQALACFYVPLGTCEPALETFGAQHHPHWPTGLVPFLHIQTKDPVVLDPKLQSSSHDRTHKHLSQDSRGDSQDPNSLLCYPRQVPQHPRPLPGDFSKSPL